MPETAVISAATRSNQSKTQDYATPQHLHTSYTHTAMSVRASDVILILVTIIFPPAGAFFVAGCGCDLLINILLTV